ncbi:HesA/MoeB/ThiF family protein [Glutamicibacter sp. TV12E]|uniref:HesA/MoeB/ThiF family protein n=1 Tax=Glutamicibacter sp. TV12E TaxID=3446362 RepID=UPI004033E42C
MPNHDPYVLMTSDAKSKISDSKLIRGALALRCVPADDMYVVHAVETAKGIRQQVVIDRQYTTLRSGDNNAVGQWIRLSENDAHIHHFSLASRPGTAIGFDAFRRMVPGVMDPGNTLNIVVTHDPSIPSELKEVGITEFVGWLISRDQVYPLQLEIEPDEIGLGQLSGKWPIELLATNSVMVVGCGSIGSSAIESLAGYGVGRVELVDPDRLLWHNTLRHILGPESVGRFKVAAMEDYLAKRWPSQQVAAHRLNVVNQAHYLAPLLKGVDMVICAADGIGPRRVVSHLARHAKKPLVMACVLDGGAVGEIVRLRPTPRFGCLLCLRRHLSDHGAMDAEADQELGYGTGHVHRPMTAVPPDLRYIGTLAAKMAVATLLESIHGDHTQQLPGELATVGLRPIGDLSAPFDISRACDIRWSSLPEPRPSCPTCFP